MKNNLWGIGIILAATIVLAGCGLTPQPASASLPLEEIPSPEGVSSDPADLKPYMVTTTTGIYNQQTAGTDEGCYTVFQNAAGTYNLFYIDYATQQLVYLSTDLSSYHNTLDDTSFLGESPGGASLFIAENHLYWVILGGTSMDGTVSVPAQIIQMDPNGSNKKVLCSLDSGQFLENTAFAFDGKHLYFFVNELEPEKRILVSLSTDTGALNAVTEFKGKTMCQLLGTYQDKLIVQTISPSEETPYSLFSISPLDKAPQKLAQWNYGERSFVIHKDKAYSFSEEDGSLRTLSLSTGKESIFAETVVPREQAAQYKLISDAYDEHIFLLDKNTNALLVIECKTGEAQHIKLQENGFNASIMAETKTDFLVFKAYKSFDYIGGSPDGTPQKQQLVLPQYALIGKENYWNSVPEYRSISYDSFIV